MSAYAYQEGRFVSSGHVRALPAAGDRRQKGTGRLRLEFWSADWSPWQALRRLQQDWPALRLTLQPAYGDG